MKGFTLLETIISVSILAAMVVGSLALISKSTQSVYLSQNKLIASYLAQEGIEIVRNVRDGNWKNGNDWDEDLLDCVNCEMDYTMNVLADETMEGGDPYLKLENNFYNYSSGVDKNTIFKRHISVSSVSGEQKQVISEIVWQYRGVDYDLAVTAFLYIWQ